MTASRAVLSLPIASIAIPEKRVGYFDALHAERLGADMAANGQHDPIHVKRNGNAAKLPWTLIAGLHRLRGARGAGRETIDAIQVADAGASREELRRLELSENLDHRHRRPIERAIMMVEFAGIEEAIDHPGRVGEPSQIRAGRARQAAGVTVSPAAGWRARTAAAMGCGIKTLERYQRIHRKIVEELPDLAEPLNFHPLGESFSVVRQLAALPLDRLHDTRRCAVEKVLERDDWGSLQEVLVAARIRSSTGSRTSNIVQCFRGNWDVLKLHEKRAHVDWLVEVVTPGMAIDMVAGFKKRGLLP